ncbi:hypothetical protein A2Z67_01845 [Candidatus Woesebacteria bacterium RBG_13_36_22]|uniref:Mannosyltransferase n=1 Tax=Candidatus Woesebacteria bacterium RBG_13_36_22 TaxID=1802478 RepID=A0A1F7X112_9BACT|nr:MAG: hypothetical protein A2Z67_01845 [Candidatus Woesebacteria bacterium RBG_13_36_22]
MDLSLKPKIIKNGILIRLVLIVILVLSSLFILKPLTYNNYPDFGSYYYSTKNLTEGRNPYFDLGNRFGFFLYPPPVLFLFLPLTLISYSVAGKIFTAISIFCFLLSIYLLLKIINIKPFSNLGMFLSILAFNFFPAKFTLGMGQINNIVLLGVILFIYFSLNKEWIYSGIFLALASLLKVWPVILLTVPLINSRWKILSSFAAVLAFVFMITYPILGKDVYYYFFLVTLPSLFTNTAGTYYNQSLSGFLLRQINNPATFKAIRDILDLMILSATLYLTMKFSQIKNNIMLLNVSVLITLSLILTSTSWQHHFVWLLVPLFLTFSYIRKNKMNLKYYFALGVSYVLVALNLKNPSSIPVLFQSHVFFGAFLLYIFDIRLLMKRINTL